MINLLKTGALALGLSLSDDTALKFVKYYESVVDYNKKVNLTAITDETEFVIKHFLDSLTAEKFIPENAILCDIGAGAGFPSVPLKLVRDDLSVTMLDALSKRVVFLNLLISSLPLSSCRAVHARAEEAARGELRVAFDVVVARAVADVKVLAEYAVPLLKKGGLFIAYKGSNLAETDGLDRVLKKLNARLRDTVKLSLPVSGDERNLLLIEKVGETPDIYPRHNSKILKNSL